MPPLFLEWNITIRESSLSDNSYDAVLDLAIASVELGNLKVCNFPQIIFICGGPIEQKKGEDARAFPSSLRERILVYLGNNHEELEKGCVVAESFSDYFQKGAYKNLLEFESDIANISALIVVCLESEGALVEFGMFVNHELTMKKLQVFVPERHYNREDDDSFIKLGPLAELESIRPNTSVLVYPFPCPEKLEYEHIDVIVGDIKSRLNEIHEYADFDRNNSGHLAFLIYEIISLAHPIKRPEIERCLNFLGISGIDERRLSSLLYLLKKIKHAGSEKYSGIDYFYPINPNVHRINFGKDKEGKLYDRRARFIEIRSTFGFGGASEGELAKKRRLVMMKIAQKISSAGAERK